MPKNWLDIFPFQILQIDYDFYAIWMLKKIYICNLQNQNSILRVKGNKSGLLFKQECTDII